MEIFGGEPTRNQREILQPVAAVGLHQPTRTVPYPKAMLPSAGFTTPPKTLGGSRVAYKAKGMKSHVLFWVRIMKRRVRTAVMPFLLSVFVLCLSKLLC